MPSTRPQRRPTATTTNASRTSDDDGAGDALEELTRPELLAIHRAFDAVAAGPSLGSAPRGISPSGGGFVREESDGGGGFVREDASGNEGVGAGGFVPEDGEGLARGRRAADTIGLAQVPAALRMLGLAYRDSSIVDIFADAASSDDERADDGARDKRVRRADFARVCAVLMVARRGAASAGEASDGAADGDGSAYGGPSEAASSASDDSGSFRPSRTPATRKRPPRAAHKARYVEDNSASETEPSPAGSSARKARRQNKRTGKRSHRTSTRTEEDDEEDHKITAAKTFGLFFGLPESDDLSNRSIGFEDIKRVLNELGEEMKDEEIQEMLDYASYSNNSRVNIHAFQKLIKEIRSV